MGKIFIFLMMLGVSLDASAFGAKRVDFGDDDGFPGSSESDTGLASCESIPPEIEFAYKEALAFSKSCPAANLAPGKRIAINNYSGKGTPSIYVFDQSGNCVGTVGPIAWGRGGKPPGSLQACSGEGSNQTPPGFHLTTPHSGSLYQNHNSMGLASLSGQNSYAKRSILIHVAEYAGRGASIGCTGVMPKDFPGLKASLGHGSLVYNYFGSKQNENCRTNAGFGPPSCLPEEAAVKAHDSAWAGIQGRRSIKVTPTKAGSSEGQGSGRSGLGGG